MIRVKSIQQGTLQISATPTSTGTLGTATATISSVDTKKAIVEFEGFCETTSGYIYPMAVELNSTTTVKAYMYLPSGELDGAINWQVIEFY